MPYKTLTTFEEIVIKRLTRIENLLNRKTKATQTWVKVGIVQDLTGWDLNFLRKARENGLIKFRKEGKRNIDYLLESIHPQFLKK